MCSSAADARKRPAKCACAHKQADDNADAVLLHIYKKMIARHPCGTQSNSLPLLPSGPGGVRKSLLRRTRLSNRKISGGEGGIRTHGTLPHTRVPGVHLKPLGHLSSVLRTNWRWPMGHHITTPVPSCKEQNGADHETPASHKNFINYSREMRKS